MTPGRQPRMALLAGRAALQRARHGGGRRPVRLELDQGTQWQPLLSPLRALNILDGDLRLQ